jgi:hypothetical protein
MTKPQPTVEEEARYYAGVLRQAIRAAGYSVSEVERQLGLGPKALRRVFGGQIDLKFRHMVAILRVIGMSQEEFLSIAIANRQKMRRKRVPGGEFLAAFENAGYTSKPAPMDEDQGDDLSDEDFDRRVEGVLKQLMRRRAARNAEAADTSETALKGMAADMAPDDDASEPDDEPG